MKKLKLLTLLATVFAMPLQATSRTLNVAASAEDKSIKIEFSTKKMHSSMCMLVANKLSVELDSSIEIVAARVPGNLCLAAAGPHSGSLSLAMGSALPAIDDGTYSLTINGENYGELVVENGKVHLDEPVDL